MENLEDLCLNKLNKLLSKFALKIVIVRSICSERQYRLIDDLDIDIKWICLWTSLSDMLFNQYTSIFNCLDLYYGYISNDNFILRASHNTVSKYERYYNAYKVIRLFKSNSVEEFLITCDLNGV